MLTIHIDNDITLATLREQIGTGTSAIQVQHCGNVPIAKVWLGHVGVHSLFYGWTYGARDKKNKPHGIVKEGHFTQMADPFVFGRNCKTTDQSSLAHLHISAFRAAASIADTNDAIEYGDHLNKNREVVVQILRVLFKYSSWNATDDSETWGRTVGLDGKKSQGIFNSFDDLLSQGIAGVTGDFGFIIPLKQTVFLVLVLEALRTGCNRMYYLGSSTSLGHFTRYQTELSGFLSSTADITGVRDIELLLTDVAGTTLTVPTSFSGLLDNVIDLYLIFKRHPTNNNHAKLLRVLFKLQGIFDPTRLSQHDLVQNREGTYLPELLLATKLSDLKKWSEEIRCLYVKHKRSGFRDLL